MSEKFSEERYLAIVELHGKTVTIEGGLGEVLDRIGTVLEVPRNHYPKKVWGEEVRMFRLAREENLADILKEDHPLREALFTAKEPEVSEPCTD